MADFINPYSLLGVTIDTTKEELKKRYYELSLIMHPDKGGNSDDMITLQTAYNFILREISGIDREVTVEQLENEFKQFCSVQERTLPQFQDIYADAFDLPKFNDYFQTDTNNVVKASIEGGYGDMMEQSQVTVEYNEKDKDGPINMFNAISTYTCPINSQQLSQNVYSLDDNNMLDNYSMEVNGLCMSDYKEAYSVSDEVTKRVAYTVANRVVEREEETDNERTLDDIEKERAETVYNPLNNYIWSFEGFLDKTRKQVANFLRLTL